MGTIQENNIFLKMIRAMYSNIHRAGKSIYQRSSRQQFKGSTGHFVQNRRREIKKAYKRRLKKMIKARNR